MHSASRQSRKATRLPSVTVILLLALTTFVIAAGGGRYPVAPWSFGLNGDTQWTLSTDPTGENPDFVSAAIAKALNQKFIENHVKFVIQVGDLSDRAGNASRHTRAAANKSLHDAGIGFFPLRGNHDALGSTYGLDPEYNMNLPEYFRAFPQTKGTANTYDAYNFSFPEIDVLEGLSYSYDYGSPGNNARFVVVDVEKTSFKVSQAPKHDVYGQGYSYYDGTYTWVVYKHTEIVYDKNNKQIQPGKWFRIDSSTKPSTNFYGAPAPTDNTVVLQTYSSTGTEYWPGTQQSWIDDQLRMDTRGTEHAFVFSHRGLMGANHVDCFFGSNPGSKEATQNPFYASLMGNGVKYMISGHDHIHNRAIVKSPDGASQVEQIISIGASSKFYAPAKLSAFNGTYGDVKLRETQISQEIINIGYYIYTIDGPRVTVDYYSDAVGNFKNDAEYPDGSGSGAVPNFNFIKKETWGYSKNGEQHIVAQGNSYTGIDETFGETSAKILSGANGSTSTDFTPETPRALTKTVNTGWTTNPTPDMLKSDIFSLWGMSELGAAGKTDTYVLSMSVNWKRMVHLGKGSIGIATFVNGKWVNAVSENIGGETKFMVGPYSTEYGLGTYGVDPETKTAWAVLNFNADFAVRGWADGDQDDDGDVDDSDVKMVISYRNKPASECPSADIDKDGKITSLDVRKIMLLKTPN